MPDSSRDSDEKQSGSLVDATLAAFRAAKHLTDADEGAKQALIMLARKIDAWDIIVDWAVEEAFDPDSGRTGRPAVPLNDNVSISAYLKGCEQLGLTPSGRAALLKPKPAEKGAADVPEDKQAKVSRLRAVNGK